MNHVPEMESALKSVEEYVRHVKLLHERMQRGEIKAHMPEGLIKSPKSFEKALVEYMPASVAEFERVKHAALFRSQPLVFDVENSVGPYIATIDRDEAGEPYRFLDMSQMIATHSAGENDPRVAAAVMRQLAPTIAKFAHSEYQTRLSMQAKEALAKIAPKGLPRFFITNTGAEAVENALKAVLLNRFQSTGDTNTFVISFDGAFHGRSLGALAVTQRKKARQGFPTFQWPCVIFPMNDPAAPEATLLRERVCLHHIYDMIVTGDKTASFHGVNRDRVDFRLLLERIDAFLAARRRGDVVSAEVFVRDEASKVSPDVRHRSSAVAGVILEPLQGEGGVRPATPRFFQRLRLLTKIFDVPLIFDEVQAGWWMTGSLWAHEQFDMPLPPDAMTWAKKAQNGVLYLNETLAQFFQVEKKFNTTWEGDSTGMVRLLAILGSADELSGMVRPLTRLTEDALLGLSAKYQDLMLRPRGMGLMRAFELPRTEIRELVEERLLRRGMICLPCGDRNLRFYPRFNMTEAQLDEAVAILDAALTDVTEIAEAYVPVDRKTLKTRVVKDIEISLLSLGQFSMLEDTINAIENQRSPLLRYSFATLLRTMSLNNSVCCVARDRSAGTIVGYVVGSPLEHHDEMGTRTDVNLLKHNTFFIQHAVVDHTVTNQHDVYRALTDRLFERISAMRASNFEYLSGLLDYEMVTQSSQWISTAKVWFLCPNYCLSGLSYAYISTPLGLNHLNQSQLLSSL